MKHLFLTFCILLLTSVFAQAQVKPVAMDFGIGFTVSGLSDVRLQPWSEDAFGAPQALARFYAIDQLAVRLRIGVNTGSQNDEFSISYIDSIRRAEPFTVDSATTNTVSQSVFSFAPGAEYHFATENKVDPYVGLEIPIAIKGTVDTEFDQTYRWIDESGVPFFQQDINRKETRDGGFSIGVNLLAGFNYFFSEHIAIGAEYGIGFFNRVDGGSVRVATTGTLIETGNIDNVISIDETQVFEESSASNGLRTQATGGINLSLFF